MRARDWIFTAGTFFLAIGPELQTEGGTKAEWKTGRYSRIAGVGLMGISRAFNRIPRKKDEEEDAP